MLQQPRWKVVEVAKLIFCSILWAPDPVSGGEWASAICEHKYQDMVWEVRVGDKCVFKVEIGQQLKAQTWGVEERSEEHCPLLFQGDRVQVQEDQGEDVRGEGDQGEGR